MMEMRPMYIGGQWELLPRVMYFDKHPPQVTQFCYRINGVIYSTRSKEFIDMFNAEKLWYQLQNSK